MTGLVRACHDSGLARCAVVSFDGWRPRLDAGGVAEPAIEERRHGAPVLRLDRPSQLSAIESFARAFGAERIQVHDALLWEAGSELAQSLGATPVYTAHVLQAELQRLRGLDRETLAGAAEARAFREAEEVFAPSRFVERTLLTSAAPPRAVVFASLGVDDCAAARASVERREAMSAGPVATVATPPTLLVAGRFADVNGTRELCELLPELLATEPALRVVIAGGIPENAKGERRWRRRLAASLDALPLSEHARVELCGWLAADALAERYRAATLLLAPGWIETFGLSVAEAQLHGVPVITCCGSAGEERVDDGVTGLLCPPRDPAALLAAVRRLLAEPALARRLGLAAARKVREELLWPLVLRGHIQR